MKQVQEGIQQKQFLLQKTNARLTAALREVLEFALNVLVRARESLANINKLRGGIKVYAVKAPGFGENRKAKLKDLATLTGGEVITEELRMNLENFEPQMLGTCKMVTVSKDDTIILDGAGDKKNIEERVEQFRSTIEESTSDYDKEKLQEQLRKALLIVLQFRSTIEESTSDYDKEKLQERLAKLPRGVAVLKDVRVFFW